MANKGRVRVSDEEKASWAILGKELARRREHNGKSQIATGKDMGHANGNFIGIIESGQAKIPNDAIDAFALAYRCDIKKLRLLIAKYYNPQVWTDGVLYSIELREGKEAAEAHDKYVEGLLKELHIKGLRSF